MEKSSLETTISDEEEFNNYKKQFLTFTLSMKHNLFEVISNVGHHAVNNNHPILKSAFLLASHILKSDLFIKVCEKCVMLDMNKFAYVIFLEQSPFTISFHRHENFCPFKPSFPSKYRREFSLSEAFLSQGIPFAESQNISKQMDFIVYLATKIITETVHCLYNILCNQYYTEQSPTTHKGVEYSDSVELIWFHLFGGELDFYEPICRNDALMIGAVDGLFIKRRLLVGFEPISVRANPLFFSARYLATADREEDFNLIQTSIDIKAHYPVEKKLREFLSRPVRPRGIRC